MIGTRSFVSRCSAAVLAAALAVFTASAAPAYSIRWVPNAAHSNKVAVEVAGLAPATLSDLRRPQWTREHWRELLSVYVEQDDLAAQLFVPPMLGAYTFTTTTLRFDPQFPLQPGIRYRAVFRPQHLPGGKADKPLTSTFALPKSEPVHKTSVTQIFPSADVLPENLLKFYVHFSAPMSRGQIYDHIELREAGAAAVELPFLQIDEELWDANMTRLTLFIDPGRIKRGVLPLEEVGPALETGKKYELIIRDAWKDAAGGPLKNTFVKRFTVGVADRQPPDHTRWQVHSPKSRSREPLTVAFGEPMDHALAVRLLAVTGPSGEMIAGEKKLRDSERQWVFVPDNPWRLGQHQLVVQTHIEDLAGNNIGKPFEVDLFDGVQRRLANSVVKLPFAIR